MMGRGSTPAGRLNPAPIVAGTGTFAKQLAVRVPPNGYVLVVPGTSVAHTYTFYDRNGGTTTYAAASNPWVNLPFPLDGAIYEQVNIDVLDANVSWVSAPAGSALPFSGQATAPGTVRQALIATAVLSSGSTIAVLTTPNGYRIRLIRISVTGLTAGDQVEIAVTSGALVPSDFFNGAAPGGGTITIGPEPGNTKVVNPPTVMYASLLSGGSYVQDSLNFTNTTAARGNVDVEYILEPL